ncbi:ATP-binding cassette domain-containing protein [Methanomethylophilus alvi]|uniref:ATP-binding cassette domain-containing protein n=1 Tax=Methanomethylophilus alvi TaxID=1291540 RepID=UPI0037DCAE5F
MDPKNAIEIRNIVKTFKIEVEDPEKKGGILNRNHTKTIENKVLDGITLDIRKGDVLGVLGRNGSGKSTFLSMIARIMEPDSGTIECSGKVASILELGMGFHPDMSGRENIYLKGELYGFSRKEMDSKIDRIIEYSGISKYIDNPVRTYSSGMSGRLAFSIMMNVESDIVLVDEILSVGDAAFENKAKEHFKNISKDGKTILIVSHLISTIESICTRVIWIEDGSIVKDGPAKEVCYEYQNAINESPEVIMDLANNGVSEAQYKLALLYRDGIKFEKNDDLYCRWIKLAAEQGHTKAQYEYGNILMKNGNEADAKILFQHAAAKGDNEAKGRIALMNSSSSILSSKLLNLYKEIATLEDPINEYRYAELLLKTAISKEDRCLSFEMFKKSAMGGFPNAYYQLALMCRDGIGTERDTSAMVNYLVESSNAGFLPAILLLSDLYFKGNLISKNESLGFHYAFKAAQLGNINSMYTVAHCYQDGIGVNQDSKQSELWYGNYVKSGFFWHLIWSVDYVKSGRFNTNLCLDEIYDAVYLTSNPWATGHIVPYSIVNDVDCKHVIDYLSFLSENNNLDAIKRLANMYYSGDSIEKDYSKALQLYVKSSKLGDSWSKLRVGEMYRDGLGTQVNLELALSWFESSANNNNISAIVSLLNIYNLDAPHYALKIKEWHNCLESFAKNGNVEAIRAVGNNYKNGIFVTKNYEMALYYYQLGEKINDSYCRTCINEMINTGLIARAYRDGKGVPQDLDMAAEWMRKAADRNIGWAKNELFEILRRINTPESLAEMIRVGTDFANAGDGTAMGLLARAYRDGKGVPQDLDMAAEWMRKAADRNIGWAKNELFEILRNKGDVL